jgi:Extensin-like protein C-terminus
LTRLLLRRFVAKRSFLPTSIAAMMVASWAGCGFAASDAAPPVKEPVKQPAKAEDKRALVSICGMPAADFAACVADLRSAKVVFEPVDAAKDAGCELSGAVRLVSVATPFGGVAIVGKPTMLCSFARQFSVWSRNVAAPLTLAYTGQKLTEIEAGSAFACRARTDKPGAIPSEHAKGNAIDISSFVLAYHRRVRVKQPESDFPLAHDLVGALYGPRRAVTSRPSSARCRIPLTRNTSISTSAFIEGHRTTASASSRADPRAGGCNLRLGSRVK